MPRHGSNYIWSVAKLMPAATIVFLDIVGYSKKSSAQQVNLRQEMRKCVRGALDQLFGAAVAAVTRDHTGDGTMLAFSHETQEMWTGDSLLRFIFRLHQWARDESGRERNGMVRLRVGVHSGVIENEEKDINGSQGVVGPTVNEAKRIMDVANAGQTLFSTVFVRNYFGEERQVRIVDDFVSKEPVEGRFVGPFHVMVKHRIGLQLLRLQLASADLAWDNRPATAEQPGVGGLTAEFIGLLLVHLAVCGGWIVALWFQNSAPGLTSDSYADLWFCLKKYPHLSIYPLVFGWPVAFCLWKASRLLWGFDFRRLVVGSLVLSGFVAAIGTRQDAVGEYMMLHEFSPFVQAQGMAPSVPPLYPVVARQLGEDGRHLETSDSQQENLRLFSYRNLWQFRQGWQSSSRPLYLLLVFYIEFMLIYLITISALLWGFTNIRQEKYGDEYYQELLYYLLMAMASLLIWVPFRMYYNLEVKGPLFGLTNVVDNTVGRLLNKPSAGLTPSEFFPGLLALMYVFALAGPQILPHGNRGARLRYVFGVTFCALVGLALLSVWDKSVFSDLVGIGAEPIGLVGRGISMGIYLLISYRLVNTEVRLE